MSKHKGFSDSTMLKLFNKAVLIKNGGRCFLCGKTDNLEVHHIVKRRNKILRYDYRNGIPVCKYGCHQEIDSIAGLKLIEVMRPFDIIHCSEFQNMPFKEYLVKRGITEKEFLEEKKKELNEIIRISGCLY